MNKNLFLNIAGYKFEQLDSLDTLIPEFQNKCDELELKGSVYLSPRGINFSISGTEANIEKYIEFMESDSRFLNIPLKRTYSETQPFRSCLLYTSPSPRDVEESRMPSSA